MKILAVDDDQIILKLLEQIMTAIGGHDVTFVVSGPKALAEIKSADEPFDCFMFDIQMPEMDGIELVKHVRGMSDYIDTPVLMLTAMSDKRYIDKAFAVGATDYVTKPFEVTELQARLGILERHARTKKAISKNIFASDAPTEEEHLPQEVRHFEVYEPISIYDVDNVIDHTALENYLAQLSKSSLFGSTIFAFGVRRIDEYFSDLSPFEFCSLISDVAEVISDTLQGRQFLMSYGGNGVYLCVTEAGWRPDLERLNDSVNLALTRTELYNNKGERLEPRVATGEAIRLVWKSGDSLVASLATAHSSAEEAAIRKERELRNIWLVETSA